MVEIKKKKKAIKIIQKKKRGKMPTRTKNT